MVLTRFLCRMFECSKCASKCRNSPNIHLDRDRCYRRNSEYQLDLRAVVTRMCARRFRMHDIMGNRPEVRISLFAIISNFTWMCDVRYEPEPRTRLWVRFAICMEMGCKRFRFFFSSMQIWVLLAHFIIVLPVIFIFWFHDKGITYRE